MKNMAAAIDFGTSKVVTLVAESGGYHRCDIIGAGQVPYDGYIDGYWNTPEKVDDAIRDSIQEAEAQSHRLNLLVRHGKDDGAGGHQGLGAQDVRFLYCGG